MRTVFLVIVSSIALNAALAVTGRGSFGHGIAVLALIMYVAAPAALVGVVASIAAGIARSPAGWALARVAFGHALAFASTVASLPIGAAILQHDIAAAKTYCESLLPQLEDYKRREGAYPADIELLGELPTPPRLLEGSRFYHGHGAEFHLSFANPAGMLNGFVYESRSSDWQPYD